VRIPGVLIQKPVKIGKMLIEMAQLVKFGHFGVPGQQNAFNELKEIGKCWLVKNVMTTIKDVYKITWQKYFGYHGKCPPFSG
jgi:hypothetical protein